jgi:hypothetical protein
MTPMRTDTLLAGVAAPSPAGGVLTTSVVPRAMAHDFAPPFLAYSTIGTVVGSGPTEVRATCEGAGMAEVMLATAAATRLSAALSSPKVAGMVTPAASPSERRMVMSGRKGAAMGW